MPWFTKASVTPRTVHHSLSASSRFSHCSSAARIMLLPMPSFLRPARVDDLLLSVLLRHQPKRGPSLQVHSILVTATLHRNHMDQTGIRVWNTLIRHYALGYFPQEAIHLYKQMERLCCCHPLPTDTFTFSFLLKACANLSWPCAGAQFHGLTVKKGLAFNVYVATALVNMYATCGSLVEARRAFDEMPYRNSVSWNAMITALASWGELAFARLLFSQMPDRNVISWTGLIDGYTRADRPLVALDLFRQMMAEGLMPTEITVLAIAPTISSLGALDKVEALHAYSEKRGLSLLDVRVENSLIDMYGKCGSMEDSYKFFEHMGSRRNLVSWTSIVSGFAMHGMANEAMKLFDEMRNGNFKPNRVTFLSMLNACNHGGLVEAGLRLFISMVYDYGIEPEIQHYGCMIDLLGRAGRLKEAEDMIAGMPMEVNVVVWRTLLGGCSKHGEVEIGERVMRRIMELEKGYSGDYVVLSNMLTEAGRFDDAEGVRRLMHERNVPKVPGLSLIT
ncbi:Pentatricopeptide repeat-containing protein [Musa troglodytarum]|uniref:Pentatricopeptide repeat-containing protein n=1 Tax=Musa troglodytarum TaxID=320322 RepID=A0A9E7EZ96_9LILI|nr:Pentatricopeptide repeat-containing protein [Musa troglodytarum]